MKFRRFFIALLIFAGIAVFTVTAQKTVCASISENRAPAAVAANVENSNNIYKATFTVDGKVYASIAAEPGLPIIPPEDPVKEGYTFAGWSPAVPDTMPQNDVSFEAKWTPKTYLAVFVIDGAFYDSVNVDCGEPVKLPEYPAAKEGCSFSGWLNLPDKMPPGGITVYGNFLVNSYNLIYLVDGKVTGIMKVDYGSPVTAIEEPFKTGYTFSGWQNLPAVMPAEDVEVFGSFSVNKYTIIYIVDGREYLRVSNDYDSPLTAIEEPYKTGYTFSGWQSLPAVMPAEDVEVYGNFSVNKYSVVYIVDGREYLRVSYDYGSPLTAIAEPVKTGYIFSGWSTMPATMPAEDIEVIGTFSAKPREIQSIQITEPPYKDTQPVQGLFFDPKGMAITAYYDDGSTVKIEVTNALINSGTIAVTPKLFNNAGVQAISVKYLGMSASVTVTVAERSASNISIAKFPSKTVFVVGDALDLSGGEICINYNNSTRSFLDIKSSSVKATGYNPAKTGTQTVTLTYTSPQGKQFTASYIISVKALGIPGDVKAEPYSYNSNKISWSAVSGATGYAIYRSSSVSGFYIKLTSVKLLYFTDSALTTNSMYYYKLKAYRTVNGADIYGASSVIVCARPVPSAPAAPKAVSASYNSIKITWQPVSGATGYSIYRSDSNSGTYTKIITLKTNFYTNTSLRTGKTYFYKIAAYRIVNGVNIYGNSSAVVSARPVPPAPVSFTAVKTGKTGIKLSWSASAGAQGYEIYRKDSAGGNFNLIKTTTALSFSNTGLKTNNTYYYKVRPYATLGGVKIYGPFTAIKSAKPY